MDEKQEQFTVELRLDELGDVSIGVNQEQFSPFVIIGMLELAKQKMMTQFMLQIHAQRQAQQNLIVPGQKLYVP